MKAYKKILQTLETQKEKIYFIHYSCQSLSDDNEGYSPKVTSIAVLHMLSSQMHSFSVHLAAEEMKVDREQIFDRYDEIEKGMLERYFTFVSSADSESNWIHWNMTNINFGFEALEHRYRVLTGKEPIHVEENRKFNLSNILKKKYGSKYAKDPKMLSLMELNGPRERSFLTGAEEVTAFKAKEFIKLHNSTMGKVYFFREVYGKLIKNKLKTETNKLKHWFSEMYQNPIVQFLSLIGIFATVIGVIVAILKK